MDNNKGTFEIPKVVIVSEPKAIFDENSENAEFAKHPSWGDCTC